MSSIPERRRRWRQAHGAWRGRKKINKTSNRQLPPIIASQSQRGRRWHIPWKPKRHPKIIHVQLGRQVEPRTIASLPLLCANHAEFRFTAASHMVAAFSQLHHFPTIITTFPTLLFAEFEHSLCALVIVAVASSVPFHVTFLADFRLAFFAFADLAPGHLVLANVLWFYPDATAFLRTV